MPPSHLKSAPVAFMAWEDPAAYVEATLTRAQAITQARDTHPSLADDWLRRELRAVRVYMRPATPDEALDLSDGDHEEGYIECGRGETDSFPMWKVEPR